MSITYEIRDLFILLLKKWYIILATSLLFGVIAYPLATSSYNVAVKNYEQLTTNTSSVNANNNIDTVTFLKITNGKSLYDKDNNTLLLTITRNVVDFATKDFIKESIYEQLSKNIENFNNSQLSKISLSYLNELPIIMIQATDTDENILTSYLDSFQTVLKESMEPIIGEKFSIEIIYDKVIKTKNLTITEEESLHAFNKIILKKPTYIQSRVKIMGTAMLFGLLLSCGVVLVNDFCQTSKKIRNNEF